MVAPHGPAPIQRIPVDRIVVGNPRERNRVAFKELVDSIAKVGLKRPITVSGGANGEAYQLVCGQGRLEAFIALGQTAIPAVIRDYTVEERLVHSVIENVARRHHRPKELLQDIGAMRQRGYTSRFVTTMLETSRPADRIAVKNTRTPKLTPEQVEQMQAEMAGLQERIKEIEGSYGTENLKLVLGAGYVASLLQNTRVTRFLSQRHKEIYAQFERIAKAAAA
ncbi:ParB/RepB/Spo0J family partition protein [Paracoccus denitrificans]|uniref:ParB/RepB/Spo0J family partition protein n=1 Tax=Paracoccus denitrificans TaxID=266 RepID=UPI001E3308E0|nr:ParB/RepB/Spo0J family partition protein [Paracoccus denitrificans]UFS67421.1 ParB/RepB/Spo0J family partition protein [Paracoccus denitrificans]